MPKYKKCPRCEINYIPIEEEYCELCLKELKGEKDDFDLTLEDIEDAELCPVCRKNYLDEGEEICKQCALERELSEGGALSNDIEEEDDSVSDDEKDIDARTTEDEEWLSLDEMQDEAFTQALEEEEEEEEEEENGEEPVDKDFIFDDLDLPLGALDDEDEEDDKKSDDDM